jgi:hypothetical protein
MVAPQFAATRSRLTRLTLYPALTTGTTQAPPAETMTLTAAPLPSFVPEAKLRLITPPRPTLLLAV